MKLFYAIIIFHIFSQAMISPFFFWLITFQTLFNQEFHCIANNIQLLSIDVVKLHLNFFIFNSSFFSVNLLYFKHLFL